MKYVVVYLAAIVIANLTVARFGPSVAVVNAFLWIGLDLTLRDKLHDAWDGRRLAPKMIALIMAGSLLSYALNRQAGPIALASFAAFSASGIVDATAYHLLKNRRRMIRVNGSNIPSALTDSLIFPALAFGGFLPAIVAGQFVAKVTGGFVWSIVIDKMTEMRARAAWLAANGGES